MRSLARLFSGVGAVVAATFGAGGAGATEPPSDAVELRTSTADGCGWSEAARERLRAKARLQEYRIAFTKKGTLERNVDPNLQPGSNRFTKKAGTEGTNLFTKKSVQEGLGTMENAFKKKGMIESTPQIQQNPNLNELLLPATPKQ